MKVSFPDVRQDRVRSRNHPQGPRQGARPLFFFESHCERHTDEMGRHYPPPL